MPAIAASAPAHEPFRFPVGATSIAISDDAVLVGEEEVHLSDQETQFLSYLAANAGRVRSKLMILNELYPSGGPRAEFKIVDVLACKTSKRLGGVHADAEGFIETSWGRGYGVALARPDLATLPALNASKTITGRSGLPLTADDLPGPGTTRWVVRRKANVVELVESGLVPRAHLFAVHPDLGEDEYDEWRRTFVNAGQSGLRVTTVA